MALLTEISDAEAARVVLGYGVKLAKLTALVVGSVNSNFLIEGEDGRRYFMRIYEEQDPEGAQNEMVLLSELVAAGIPTTLPLTLGSKSPSPLGSRWLSEHAGKPVALYPWIVGETLCTGRVTPAHTRELGAALARLHATSDALSRITPGRFGVAQLEQRLGEIERATDRFADDVALIRTKLATYVASAPHALPSGIVHGDLFRDNVLWQLDARRGAASQQAPPQIAALIDFESACRGSFLFDIMVCLEAWCYADAFDLDSCSAFLAGYESLRPLSALERESYAIEGSLVALRFATTRITDFSMRVAPGETPARDYRRFLARLDALEGGALHSIFVR